MSVHKNYVYDLGLDIKLRALEARAKRDTLPEGSSERAFYSGLVMGFNEAISIMQQNAQGFGIPLAELRLDDIDPDRDLV